MANHGKAGRAGRAERACPGPAATEPERRLLRQVESEDVVVARCACMAGDAAFVGALGDAAGQLHAVGDHDARDPRATATYTYDSLGPTVTIDGSPPNTRSAARFTSSGVAARTRSLRRST